jgi:phosphate transport system substrate-binding protein
VAIDRKPGQPLDPKVGEFLRYVLSDEGQAAVAREGSYLPLAPAQAQRVAQKLE